MDFNNTINYHLYIDECGDQNLETFSPTFPIFTLCGILVRDDLVPRLEEQIRSLKREFWGNRQIILHSRDIRKCQNGFEVLFNLDIKRRFYESINQLLGQRDVYVIVCCSILKEPYIRTFGRFNDVYGQSLSFILERAIFCVDNQCTDRSGSISAIVERRGKREDKNLMNYYQQLLDKGTYWVTSERMKNRMNCLDFKWKSEDIAGLQIADLIAYPLTRHVLNPQAVNLAYDVLAPNIFRENDKLLGLKIYPSQQA
jgi:hypothetical protein